MYIPPSQSGVRIMQTGGKKACFRFPECSLSYAKIHRYLCFHHLLYV